MATIRSLVPASSNIKRHRTTVDATYQVINDGAGTLFHLSTYGSDDRESPPKVSQTIQFDREVAEQLMAALRDAFPGT